MDDAYKTSPINVKLSSKLFVRVSLQPRAAVFNKSNKNIVFSLRQAVIYSKLTMRGN